VARQVAATRIDQEDQKTVKTPLKIWIGSTFIDDRLITLRHLRPAATADKGSEAMKRFVDAIFQLLRDPGLRREILPALDAYMADPLSDIGHQSAELVLAYLDKSPMVYVLRPAPPLTDWAQAVEKIAPGSGSQLLRAFVLGGTRAVLSDQTADAALTLACQQTVRVYLHIIEKFAALRHPGLDELAHQVERGESAVWMRKQMEQNALRAKP